eukprot:COSAG02_NODE_404_length_23022_cov_305.366008_14_plen_85_part_00
MVPGVPDLRARTADGLLLPGVAVNIVCDRGHTAVCPLSRECVTAVLIVSLKTVLSDWGNALRARANFLSLQNRPKRWGTGRRSA